MSVRVANNPLVALHSTFQGFVTHFHPLTLAVQDKTRQMSNSSADHRQGSHDLTSYFGNLVEELLSDDLHLLLLDFFWNLESCKTSLRWPSVSQWNVSQSLKPFKIKTLPQLLSKEEYKMKERKMGHTLRLKESKSYLGIAYRFLDSHGQWDDNLYLRCFLKNFFKQHLVPQSTARLSCHSRTVTCQ